MSMEDDISANKRKSFLLVVLVTFVLVALGYVFAMIYEPGLVFVFMIVAVVISTLGSVFTYWNSDTLVLAVTKTREPTPLERKHLENVVEGLAIAAGIPAPRIYIIDDEKNLNAFATGRDPEHALIAVTSLLLRTMKRDELEGVIAHEMSHIRNYDIRFATFMAVLVGIIVIASQIFLRSLWFGGGNNNRGKGNAIFIVLGVVLAILAPILTQMIQLAASRQREYLADASGARITRYPEGLAKALERIKNTNVNTKVNGAVSHMYFSNPMLLKNANSLFATHPPIDERIKRLRAM
ncbi:MAG: M48 family metallopeptidase [archaeon]